MIENKRFGIIKTKTYGLYVPVDEMKIYNFSGFEDELDCIRVVNALNDLEEKSRENGKIASKYLEENEQLKIKLEDIALDMENAKESNDDAQYELYKIKKENEQLKQDLEEYCNFSLHDVLDKKNKEIEQLKQQCKDFMEMLDDMCIAYLVNDGLEEILND